MKPKIVRVELPMNRAELDACIKQAFGEYEHPIQPRIYEMFYFLLIEELCELASEKDGPEFVDRLIQRTNYQIAQLGFQSGIAESVTIYDKPIMEGGKPTHILKKHPIDEAEKGGTTPPEDAKA